MIENSLLVDRIIRNALEEDLGNGDLTTGAIVAPGGRAEAYLLARESLILAGLSVFNRVFELLSPAIEYENHFEDGQSVEEGQKVSTLSGPTDAILMGERTALNFLQRMSGIATLTRAFVEKVSSTRARVVDTRKTAPGLRVLDKYAVCAGGGFNHRHGLYDGILIKDNHIAVAGSVSKAVSMARKSAPHTIKIEVEVEDLAGVEEALRAGADAILLDNMTPDMMKRAVKLVSGKAITEASGNVSLDNIEQIAKTGVDIISVGALTHSPRAVDLSLEFAPA